MQPAILPQNEAQRLALLHSLDLLDTPSEPLFDRITQLVAKVLNVPIALVSLIDSDRQWFKSRVGLGVTETPREVAFCAHAILRAEPFVVADATQDERFADNPLVTSSPNIRFYAGIPISSTDGLSVGTLCAIDSKPRNITDEQLDILSDLAELVNREIQLREAAALARTHISQSEETIEAGEALFQTVFERAGVGIAIVAPDGTWLRVNEVLCEITGYQPQELAQLTFQDITYQEDLNKDLNLLEQLSSGQIDRYQMEKRYIRKSGETIWVQLIVTKQVDQHGDVAGYVSIIKDIQARKEAEVALAELRRNLEKNVAEQTQELRTANLMLARTMSQQVAAQQALAKQEAELRSVIENAYDAYVCINDSGLVTAWNRQAEATFGWTAEEAIGAPLDSLIIPESMRPAHRKGMKHFQSTTEGKVLNKRLELPAIRRDGSPLSVEVRIQALVSEDHTSFSAFLHDITERKQMEAQREREARYDALTGLPNRRGFFEALPQAFGRSNRNQKAMALLFIDLDGFKAVNDTLDHEAGDALLKEVSSRLSRTLRVTDMVARLGGDEFVALLEGLSPEGVEVLPCANKLLSAARQPFEIHGETVCVSASIGVALHVPGSKNTPETLLKMADQAMYKAKRAGKNQIYWLSR